MHMQCIAELSISPLPLGVRVIQPEPHNKVIQEPTTIRTAPPSECVSLPQNWFAIRTKQMQEFKAAQHLEVAGIETFAPRIRTRNPKVLQPLFPCYIFARFDPNFYSLKTAPGVAYVLAFGGRPAIIERAIIESIREHSENMAGGPRIGDEVIITAGAFAELRGTLQREFPNSDIVRVLLHSAGMRASVEISRWDVEAAR